MTNPRDELMALAPCPFCGGEAKLVSSTSSTVQCQNDQCIIGSPAPFNDFTHRHDAIAAWNTRLAASRPAPQVVDREAAAWQWWDSVLAKWCVCSKLAFDNLADYPHIKRRELYSHPPKSPDTSAAVLAERERCAAIADEWANKMARNHGRETANTIAHAIRQLPTPERGGES